MAAETDSYQVIYKAIADFSAFSKASKEARADLQALKRDQDSYNKSAVDGSTKAAVAREADVKAIKAERDALAEATEVLKAHARAAAEDAAATKADAAAHRELANASRGSGGSGGSTSASATQRDLAQQTQATAAAASAYTKARRDATAADRDATAAERDLGGATSASTKASTDATKAEQDKATATKASSSAVKDALRTIEQYRKGQRDLDDEVRNANTVLAQHRAALRADAAAARQRIGGMQQEGQETQRLTGLLGGLVNKIAQVGSKEKENKGSSGFLKDFENGIASIESKIGSLGSAIGSAFQIGGLLSLIEPLITTLTAGGAAALGFGSDLASLGGLALAAVPGIAALLSGVGALALAFHGLTGVFQAYGAQQKAAAGASGNGTSALQQQAAAAHQTLLAQQALEGAQHSYVQSQQSVLDAEKNLHDARQQALRDLQDLNDAVKKGPADLLQAQATLQKAKENLANVMADPHSTKGDKMEAEAQVQEAQANLSDVQKQNTRNQQDLNKAQKEGVNGAPGVVSARKQVADAQWNEKRSAEALANAQYALAHAQQQAATQAGGNTRAANLYNYALSKLSPKAQEFVKGLIGQAGAWRQVKNAVQDNFFGQIVGDLGRIRSLTGPVTTLLGGAATALGKTADAGIRMISSGPWTTSFGTIAKNNAAIIGDGNSGLGGAFLKVLDIMRQLAIIAAPVMIKIANAADRGATSLDNLLSLKGTQNRLGDWLDSVYRRAQLFWQAIKNVTSGILDLARAAKPFNDSLLSGFVTATQHFKDWAAAQDKAGSRFKTFLTDVRPLISEIGKFLKDLVIQLGLVGSDPSNIKQTLGLFQKLDALLPGLGQGITTLGHLGILETILSVFKSLLGLLQALKELGFAGLLQSIATGIGWIATAIHGVAVAFHAVSDFIDWLGKIPVVGPAIRDTFHGIGDAVHWLVVALGALAGLAVVAKFTGLFKIVEAIGKIRAGEGALGRFLARRGGGGGETSAGVSGTGGTGGSGGSGGSGSGEPRRRGLGRLFGRGGGTTTTSTASEGAAAGEARGLNAVVSEVIGALERLVLALNEAATALGAEGVGGAGRGGAARAAEGEAGRVAEGDAARAGEAGLAGGAASGGRRTLRSRLGGVLRRGGGRASAGGALGGLEEETNRIISGTNGRLGLAGELGAAERGLAGAGRGGLLSRLGGFLGRGGRGVVGGLGGAVGITGLVAGVAAPFVSNLISGGQGGRSGARGAAGAVVGGALQGAALGSLFGPIGMAVGGAGGAILAALTKTNIGKNIAHWWSTAALPEIKKFPGQVWDIIKDIGSFLVKPFEEGWDAVKKGWSDFTGAVSTAAKAVWTALKAVWDTLVTVIELPFKLAWAWIQLQWTILKTIFTVAIQAITTVINTVWAAIKEFIVAPIRAAWAALGVVWTDIKSVFSSAVNWVTKTFSAAWNVVKDVIMAPINAARTVMGEVWSGIESVFSGAKDAILAVVGALKSSLSAAWDGIKAIFEDPIKFVVNTIINDGIIDGINKVLGWVGLDNLKIGHIKLPFAKGDWVPGQAGNRRVPGSGAQDTVDAVLTPGEFVIRKRAAQQLEHDHPGLLRKLNHYDNNGEVSSTGTRKRAGQLDRRGRAKHGLGDWIGDAWDTVTGAAKSAWDNTGGKLVHWVAKELAHGAAAFYKSTVMNPMDSLIDSSVGQWGMPGKIVASGGKGALSAPYHWLQSLDDAHKNSEQVVYNPSKGAAQWVPDIIQAFGTLHHDKNYLGTGSEIDAVETIIQYESGGNPRAQNNTDINAQEGHPSKGLMQTIQSTFDAYAGPYKSKGIWDPLANIYAGINYATQNYGSVTNVPGVVAVRNGGKYVGYEGGGFVDSLLKANGLSGGLERVLANHLPVNQMAGSNVTNSTVTRGGITVENLNINNPRAERASDSLPRTIRGMAYMGGPAF